MLGLWRAHGRLKAPTCPGLLQVDFLAKVAHPNILPLRGFCAEGGQQILVLDYMENGSLASWLRPATHSEGA